MALIQCPTCGHSVSDKALSCPDCGEPLPPTTTGSDNSTGAQQTPLNHGPATGAEKPHPDKKGRAGIISVVIVSVLAIVLSIVAYSAFLNGKSRDGGNDITDEQATESEISPGEYDTESDESDPEDQLEFAIREANEDLPEVIEEGMRMDKITIEGNYVIYFYTIDETLYSISDIKDNHNSVKQQIVSNIKNTSDSDIKLFISMCKSNNKGIACRYVGEESGKTHTIYIRPQEL